MEQRINRIIENYLSEFKDNIKQKTVELNIDPVQSMMLMQYIYDYERLVLTNDDFAKRKRVKTFVYLSDRCCAKRSNGEQCTRRRKDNEHQFCGTHLKGIPHGVCNEQLEQNSKPSHGQKIDVWAQDIQGIIYYIDNGGNVYQLEDVMHGTPNPKVIAKYVKNEANQYSIVMDFAAA